MFSGFLMFAISWNRSHFCLSTTSISYLLQEKAQKYFLFIQRQEDMIIQDKEEWKRAERHIRIFNPYFVFENSLFFYLPCFIREIEF